MSAGSPAGHPSGSGASPPAAPSRHRVIGTAGHVDHGKSTLIRALTGIDPDRLREEKERGMTIDLGFAWLKLPSGQEVSIVDVPGHERFIHNMLAGVGGIDIALLVVAADEGVMPQTREHLAILDLLNIETGVVALTKRDLVDGEWLELVAAEIEELLARTTLAGAPVIPVSSTTGEGLEGLLAELDRQLAAERKRRQTGWPRLPIDRVFTMAGFGTVVTGTLVDGQLRVGQEIEVLPGGLRARIRGLQSHRKKVESAPAGTRVAVNLSGVGTEELGRGNVLTAPGWLKPTRAVDVRLRMVSDAPRPLLHNAQVTLHTGSTEALGRVSLLDRNELRPGEAGWGQVRLDRPIATAKGDLFIVRFPSPSITIGGGAIVDEHPKRHRRFQERALAQLEVLERGAPEEVVLQTLQAREPAELGELAKRAAQTASEIAALLRPLIERGAVLALNRNVGEPVLAQAPSRPLPGQPTPRGGSSTAHPNGSGASPPAAPSRTALAATTVLISAQGWERLAAAARAALEAYHQEHHLRRGMPREELRKRLGLDARTYTRVERELVARGAIAEDGPHARLPEFEVALGPDEERGARAAIQEMEAAGVSPPGRAELRARHGVSEELLQSLVESGELVEVGSDLLYPRATYEKLVDDVKGLIRENGSVTVAQARDRFSTSRKYVLALLEHLDEAKVTRRTGDERVLV